MNTKPIQLSLPLSKMRTSHLRAGSLRVKESVKEALKKALNDFHLERDDIAREVSRLVGEEISIHTLNNWVAEGKSDRRFPLEVAKALTMITGDNGILEAALQPEFGLMDQKAKIAHAYGVLILENKIRSKKQRSLEEKANVFINGGFKHEQWKKE